MMIWLLGLALAQDPAEFQMEEMRLEVGLPLVFETTRDSVATVEGEPVFLVESALPRQKVIWGVEEGQATLRVTFPGMDQVAVADVIVGPQVSLAAEIASPDGLVYRVPTGGFARLELPARPDHYSVFDIAMPMALAKTTSGQDLLFYAASSPGTTAGVVLYEGRPPTLFYLVAEAPAPDRTVAVGERVRLKAPIRTTWVESSKAAQVTIERKGKRVFVTATKPGPVGILGMNETGAHWETRLEVRDPE